MKTEELFEKAEIIVDEYFHEFTEGRLERDQMIDAIWKLAEQYHEARMKDELMNFQKWYYENLYGLEMESSEEDIINNYLATRKNK